MNENFAWMRVHSREGVPGYVVAMREAPDRRWYVSSFYLGQSDRYRGRPIDPDNACRLARTQAARAFLDCSLSMTRSGVQNASVDDAIVEMVGSDANCWSELEFGPSNLGLNPWAFEVPVDYDAEGGE